MNTEYTPTSDDLEYAWVHLRATQRKGDLWPETDELVTMNEFSRWIAAHDAEVERGGAVRALRAAASTALEHGPLTFSELTSIATTLEEE